MQPNETALTAQEIQRRLAEKRGKKVMHPYTLNRAIRNQGLPARPNPFGRGYLFYWSEVEAWFNELSAPAVSPAPIRRGPGRPRKSL